MRYGYCPFGSVASCVYDRRSKCLNPVCRHALSLGNVLVTEKTAGSLRIMPGRSKTCGRYVGADDCCDGPFFVCQDGSEETFGLQNSVRDEEGLDVTFWLPPFQENSLDVRPNQISFMENPSSIGNGPAVAQTELESIAIKRTF